MAPERIEFLVTLAMAQYRLGQKQQARAALARLRDAVKTADQIRGPELMEGLLQAEALFERDNPLITVTPHVDADSKFGSVDVTAKVPIDRIQQVPEGELEQ
jgi:hypothetical protein